MNQLDNAIALSAVIRDHLIKQKAMAKEGSLCHYRTEDGKMCAVGCLIKDEYYCGSIEGSSVTINFVPLSQRQESINSSERLKDALTKSLGREITEVDTLVMKEWQWYHDMGGYYGWTVDGFSAVSPEYKNGMIIEEVMLKYGE